MAALVFLFFLSPRLPTLIHTSTPSLPPRPDNISFITHRSSQASFSPAMSDWKKCERILLCCCVRCGGRAQKNGRPPENADPTSYSLVSHVFSGGSRLPDLRLLPLRGVTRPQIDAAAVVGFGSVRCVVVVLPPVSTEQQQQTPGFPLFPSMRTSYFLRRVHIVQWAELRAVSRQSCEGVVAHTQRERDGARCTWRHSVKPHPSGKRKRHRNFDIFPPFSRSGQMSISRLRLHLFSNTQRHMLSRRIHARTGGVVSLSCESYRVY